MLRALIRNTLHSSCFLHSAYLRSPSSSFLNHLSEWQDAVSYNLRNYFIEIKSKCFIFQMVFKGYLIFLVTLVLFCHSSHSYYFGPKFDFLKKFRSLHRAKSETLSQTRQAFDDAGWKISEEFEDKDCKGAKKGLMAWIVKGCWKTDDLMRLGWKQ